MYTSTYVVSILVRIHTSSLIYKKDILFVKKIKNKNSILCNKDNDENDRFILCSL